MYSDYEDRILLLELQVSELSKFCIAQGSLVTQYYAMAIKNSSNIDSQKRINELFGEQFKINKEDLSTAYNSLSSVYKEQYLKIISDADPNLATTLKNVIDSGS